jgi:glucose/arabinose dehydrogenase/endonuclease YncB( thermonuclease family)
MSFNIFIKEWILTPRTGICLSIFLALAVYADAQPGSRFEGAVPPGGAPPPGAGTVKVSGYIRFIDAQSFETRINGNQVAIRMIGIDAPVGNTDCGKEALDFLKSLTITLPGVIDLEEDQGLTFDVRKLRMYYPKLFGRSLPQELVKAGVARANGQGKEASQLAAAENDAKVVKRGCLWRNFSGPNDATSPPSTDKMNSEASSKLASRAASVNAASPVLNSGFVLDPVVTGLVSPTNFVFLPDGRILFAEQSGLVKVFKNGSLLPTPLIDLRTKVNSFWDRGLIGMAADANFASNGYVYLMYTYENDPNDYTGPKTSRLSRFTVTGDTASLSSELVVLGTSVGRTCHDFPAGADCLSSDSQSHSVGEIRSMSDGTLWATMGDGGSFNVVDDDSLRAQDLDSLNGKVLHVTATGAGLPSNPFWNGSASANRSKVYATGMRNSYRFSLRPGTNTPYLGEVGWGTYDEINVGKPGANFGWPCYEGRYVQSGYEPKAVCQSLYALGPSAVVFSLTEWYHGGSSAAATGGVFYTGTAYPPEYQGAYFYGDYAQSLVRTLRVDANNNLTGGPFDFITSADGPSKIEAGPDLNIYYLALNAGELRRIRYVVGSDTIPPTVLSTAPTSGTTSFGANADLSVLFSEGMDPSTINTSTFTLLKQGTTTPIAATVTYNLSARTAVLHPSASLDYGTPYTATVKGNVGGTTDAAGNPLASNFTWSFSTAALPPGGTTYLSDLGPTSATNGWGPFEKDMSNGDAAAGDGRPLTLRGTVYAKGIGTHAISDLHYYIGGSCTAFTAVVGVDDEATTFGSVVFQVLTDGTKVFDSGTVLGGGAVQNVNVNLTGKSDLELVVTDAGDGISWDHGDWANAKVTCNGSTTAPVVTTTVPANNATGVVITVAPAVTFSKAMNAATLTTSTFTLVPQGSTTPVAATVSYDSLSRTATMRPSANLALNTRYTLTVKGGASGVKDANGIALVADAVSAFTTTNLQASSRYLSDMTWTSATNGWGPVEKDMSNGENAAGDGRPITLRGTVYAKGLGVHALSTVHYAVPTGCTLFGAVVGVDDEMGVNGSVVFEVYGDSTQLYSSGILRGGGATKTVSIDITGKADLALNVTDGGDGIGADHGDWANAQITCSASNTKPKATIASPAATLQYKIGDVINYSGSGSDAEDGTLPASSLAWTILIHHCPGGNCHLHPFTTGTGTGGSFTVPDHGDDSYFEIQLTVTDSGGLTDTASVSIQPKLVQITLDSSPPGLILVYGGDRVFAPFTRNTPIGSVHTITTPSPQGTQNFVSWSDGGSQQHNITMGATAATFIATFASSGPPPPTGTYLSDLAWTSATNGWGPVERDKSNGEQAAGDGGPITIAGTVYPKGLGVHAASDIRYNLAGSCSTFTASVGIDSEVGPNGSVIFTVLGDGATLYTSPILRGGSPAQAVNVSVAGKNELALQVSDAGDGNGSDHADWANALVSCTADTVPPTVSSTVPAASATGVPLTSNVQAKFSEAMNASSLSATTFTLMQQGSTTPLAASVTYDAQSTTATLKTTANLLAGTTYTATVKSGASGAKDLAGNALATDKVWTFATATASLPVKYLSDLPWTSATSGWGPVERDTSNGEQLAGDGRPITINGTVYPKGLGVHSASDIRFNLAGACSTFTATVGVDAEVGANGSVIFKVLGDTTTLYTSPILRGGATSQAVNVSVAGKNELALQVSDAGDGNGSDHADWANAQIACNAETAAPTVSSTVPAAAATGVAATSSVQAKFSEAMAAASLSTTNFTLVKLGTTTPLAATVTYNAQTTTFTLKTTANLTAATDYTATVKGGASGAKDLAGNPLAADKVWSFKTQ